MRPDFARAVESEDPVTLSTGEAARLLGVSRQHIVDLCNAGDLSFTTTGSHRRVLLSDVDALRAGSRRMTADQRRSLLLAYAVAGQIVLDPERALSIGRANVERMRSAARGAARIWLQDWSELLDGPVSDLLAVLVGPSQRSREMRQLSPFAGVLDEDQRAAVLTAAGLRAAPAAGAHDA